MYKTKKMKNETIKQIAKDLDLYGQDVLMAALKNQFSHVSFTRNAKTMPKCGSECRETKSIKPAKDMKIEKVIFNRNGAVTIKTAQNHFFQLLNI